MSLFINNYAGSTVSSPIPTVYYSVPCDHVSSDIMIVLFLSSNTYGGSTLSSPSLTIFTAANSDAGTYLCGASNSAGSTESNSISLQVSGSKYMYITVCHVMFHVMFHMVCNVKVSTTWFLIVPTSL